MEQVQHLEATLTRYQTFNVVTDSLLPSPLSPMPLHPAVALQVLEKGRRHHQPFFLPTLRVRSGLKPQLLDF